MREYLLADPPPVVTFPPKLETALQSLAEGLGVSREALVDYGLRYLLMGRGEWLNRTVQEAMAFWVENRYGG